METSYADSAADMEEAEDMRMMSGDRSSDDDDGMKRLVRSYCNKGSISNGITFSVMFLGMLLKAVANAEAPDQDVCPKPASTPLMSVARPTNSSPPPACARTASRSLPKTAMPCCS